MKISCAIMTISDTRTEKTDESGQVLETRIKEAGHLVVDRSLVADEVDAIQAYVNTVPVKDLGGGISYR